MPNDVTKDERYPYEILYKQDGVFLVVYPSKTIDKSATLNQIIERTKRKKIKNVDKKVIGDAINEATGEPVKIAEQQEEMQVDASLNIKVSPDKMQASLTINPPDGGKDLSASEMFEAIRSKGVVWGIDEVVITELAQNPRYNESIVFAEGKQSIKGEDGVLSLKFDINTDKKPTILEDGSVDFHELNYIQSVQKGQVLAEIIPPKPGVDGKNVYGQVLKAPRGKPIKKPKGKNVELTENETKVIASIDGYVSYADEKINVLTVLEIPGDVDVSTGNIRFNGNVVIEGNVLTDFVVEASGDVEVKGVVEGATIKADGNIVIKRGIQGLNKGKLISGMDVVVRYIEHCDVTAKNDIKCEAIMHSNISCGGTVEVSGKKGLIVGGDIKVGKDILAKVIGSHMCTTTNIELGADPQKRERYKEAKQEYDESQDNLNRITKNVEVLRKAQSAGTMTPQKTKRLNQLLTIKSELNNKLEELEEEVEELEKELDSAKKGKIKVRKIIYPGVKITIANMSKFIMDPEEFVTIYLEGADIKSVPFD